MGTACCLKDESERSRSCVCGYEELLAVVGKRWAMLILQLLQARGGSRYNDLFHRIAGITPKAFGEKLKALAEQGVIERTVTSDLPLRTKYSLTPKGEKVLAAIKPLLGKAEKVGWVSRGVNLCT